MLVYKIYFKNIKTIWLFDVYCLFALALTPIFQWSKFSISSRVQDLWRCLLQSWMEALSTRAEGVWGWGSASRPGCGMFSYRSFEKKKQSWAGLWASSESETNKRGDSPQSTLHKQSEAATNGGRSCCNSKTKMKERQLPRTSLGPYQDGWVLCQTMTIISGPCCVKSSKSPFFIDSHLCSWQ